VIYYSFCFSQNTKIVDEQNYTIDSLLTFIKTSKEDSNKVNLLNSLFLEYEFKNDSKAKESLTDFT